MYRFEAQQSITGTAAAVWSVWSDPDRFPQWDPREERTTLHGAFAVGSTIDSKQKGNPGGTARITVVEPNVRWTVTSPLPGGALVIDHVIAPDGAGRVMVGKSYEVTGPLTPLFRWYYGPRVVKALPETFAALEAEVARRG